MLLLCSRCGVYGHKAHQCTCPDSEVAAPTDRRAEGEAVRWLQRVLDGTSVKISSGNWRVEKDHWHGITMSVSFARTLSVQLAEAQRQRDDYAAMWESADARPKPETGE